MKLTNKLNLPQAFVDAVKNDGYSSGDANIGVTTLIDSPRVRMLTKKYSQEITEDVSDRVWSLFGQSIHSVLERANKTGIAERRLSMQVAGWKVGGGMDLVDEDGVLTDYKVTSVWSVIFMPNDKKWEQQLNCYAALLRANGHPVKKLQVVAMMRDWVQSRTKEETYPQAAVVNIDIPLWPEDVALQFMKERVLAHQEAEFQLPECTSEERWEKPTVYAVMKKGQKNAVRGGLHDNKEAAFAMAAKETGLYVDIRPGASTRCESYCSVAKFCTQYQATLKSEKETA